MTLVATSYLSKSTDSLISAATSGVVAAATVSDQLSLLKALKQAAL